MYRELTALLMLLQSIFIWQLFCRPYAPLLHPLLDTLLYFIVSIHRRVSAVSVEVGNDYTPDELFKLLDIGIGDWRLVVVLFDFLGSKRLVAKVKLA